MGRPQKQSVCDIHKVKERLEMQKGKLSTRLEYFRTQIDRASVQYLETSSGLAHTEKIGHLKSCISSLGDAIFYLEEYENNI